MENKAFQYYKDLPPWAKGVVVVGGLAVIILTINGITRRFRAQKDLKESLKESEDASAELENLQQQGVRPTLSNSEYQSIINGLITAMNGCGTDEDAVYNQMSKLKNDADVKKLISLWGVQYYEPCAASQPISYTRWMWNDKTFGGPISAWFNYDLTTTEINKINDMLQSKGIKHKF